MANQIQSLRYTIKKFFEKGQRKLRNTQEVSTSIGDTSTIPIGFFVEHLVINLNIADISAQYAKFRGLHSLIVE